MKNVIMWQSRSVERREHGHAARLDGVGKRWRFPRARRHGAEIIVAAATTSKTTRMSFSDNPNMSLGMLMNHGIDPGAAQRKYFSRAPSSLVSSLGINTISVHAYRSRLHLVLDVPISHMIRRVQSDANTEYSHQHPGTHSIPFRRTNYEYGSAYPVACCTREGVCQLFKIQDPQTLATGICPVGYCGLSRLVQLGKPCSRSSLAILILFVLDDHMSSSAGRSNCLSWSTLAKHCPAVTLPISVGIRLSTT